jgi:hypothetical protein
LGCLWDKRDVCASWRGTQLKDMLCAGVYGIITTLSGKTVRTS